MGGGLPLLQVKFQGDPLLKILWVGRHSADFIDPPVLGHVDKECFEWFVGTDIGTFDGDNVELFGIIRDWDTECRDTELPDGDLERYIIDCFGHSWMRKGNDDRI